MSTVNKAIVVTKAGEAQIQEVSIPKLRDDYIIIKTKAVALNPTDWKHIDFVAPPGARIGCDYAGIVEEVGKGVNRKFKKGDRVAGFAHGGNATNFEDGAFQTYITAKGDIQMPIPDNMSFEEASTLGVGISTVGQALYQSLSLPLPQSNQTPSHKQVLIYGGSTATGALAIQFALLSGLDVITTCSPHSVPYLTSLGVPKEAIFDYSSPTCSADINAYTNNNLRYAFDCISEGSSTEICVSSLSTTSGGTYTTLLPVPEEKVKAINEKVECKTTLAYTIKGEEIKFGPATIPAKGEDWTFGVMFWGLARELLADGRVKVHKVSVDKYGKGLEGVMEGMQVMREGKLSGEKLVFTM